MNGFLFDIQNIAEHDLIAAQALIFQGLEEPGFNGRAG